MKPLYTLKSKEWTLPDIMDLEYFLEQDQQTHEQDDLKKRDRTLYLDKILPWLEGADVPDMQDGKKGFPGKLAILKWLELRRCEAKAFHKEDAFLPGSIYRETLPLMVWLFLLGGMFLGITVVASFFSYAGARPLNISYYLSLTLLGQLILFFLSMIGLFTAGTKGPSFRMPVLQRMLGMFVHSLVEKIKEKSLKHISGNHRDAMTSALGLVRAKHRIYGALFLWPLFVLGQLFALGFNVGVLLTTLARVFFSDTAFGWQSTLKVGPELVHGLVSMVALPWAWLLPEGIGLPTMEQIAGSRMILKDGIYHLTTADLISWWPFLCLCVFFYGFVPRLVMVAAGQWMKKRSIAALAFDHASCQRLLTRMTTPVFSIDASISNSDASISNSDTSISNPDASISDSDISIAESMVSPFVEDDGVSSCVENKKVSQPSKPEPSSVKDEDISFSDILQQSRQSLVLVSEDMADELEPDELARQVLRHCGTTMVKQMIVGVDTDLELEMIQSICDSFHGLADNAMLTYDHNKKGSRSIKSSPADLHKDNAGVISSIVWVQEAWQPPIKEIMSFLKALRGVAGDGMDLVVALVGKPRVETVFTPPCAMDLSVWHKKVDALGDPRLRIESLEVLS